MHVDADAGVDGVALFGAQDGRERALAAAAAAGGAAGGGLLVRGGRGVQLGPDPLPPAQATRAAHGLAPRVGDAADAVRDLKVALSREVRLELVLDGPVVEAGRLAHSVAQRLDRRGAARRRQRGQVGEGVAPKAAHDDEVEHGAERVHDAHAAADLHRHLHQAPLRLAVARAVLVEAAPRVLREDPAPQGP